MVLTTETAVVDKPAEEDEHAGHRRGHQAGGVLFSRAFRPLHRIALEPARRGPR